MRRRRLILGIAALLLPAAAFSQENGRQNVEVDPVQCWWRTSTPSIRVGEHFTVHLTCAALETDAATAVIDRSRLGTASVQFPPFEVVGGRQSADYVTTGRRFMQYHYTLRLIAEDFFGSDIVIPPLSIAYRIESRVQPDAAVQGREQEYEMPALTVRVQSLVGNDATHIREAAVPSFDDIAAREFRARLFRITALILFAIAGLLAAMAAVRWVQQRRRGDAAAAEHLLPARTVLARVRGELRDIEQQARGGWSLDLLVRALAATRIAASYLAGQTVAQHETVAAVEGEIGVTRGIMGRRRLAVSASTTALDLQDIAAAADVHAALETFTAARYARADRLDGPALDEALASALRGVDRAASRHTWFAETARALTQTVRGWAPRAWAR